MIYMRDLGRREIFVSYLYIDENIWVRMNLFSKEYRGKVKKMRAGEVVVIKLGFEKFND